MPTKQGALRKERDLTVQLNSRIGVAYRDLFDDIASREGVSMRELMERMISEYDKAHS